MKLTVLFGTLGGLLVLAFVANRLFRRSRIPEVVVLMATGLLLGPVFGWVNAVRFEGIAHAFGTLAVILILFEGGLELDIRGTSLPGRAVAGSAGLRGDPRPGDAGGRGGRSISGIGKLCFGRGTVQEA